MIDRVGGTLTVLTRVAIASKDGVSGKRNRSSIRNPNEVLQANDRRNWQLDPLGVPDALGRFEHLSLVRQDENGGPTR